jgi:hypothetical protein
MVSQALVQSKMFYGLGNAASALGVACNWYRGTVATTNPILTGSLLGTIQAAFQIPGAVYVAPSRYAKPEWWGLFDGTNVEVGDYIVEPTLGTFFVASLEPVHYPMCVRCNRVASFARPNPNPASTPAYSLSPDGTRMVPGTGFYGGDVPSQETPLATSWPISQLQGTKGEKGSTNLPGDVRMPWIVCLVPAFPGDVVLAEGDRMRDDLGKVWTLSSCELTPLGWRLTAMLEDT